MSSSIRRWSRKGTQVPTHVLMNGGQLHVPEEDIDAFWNEYVSAIFAGQKLYVVEQKTERFKFFVDLDFKHAEPLGEDSALEICQRIHEVVATGRCLAARAPPRPLKDGLIKSGLHVHWPDVIVGRTEAMALRTRILLALEDPSWAQVIDSSVYGGSGLRCLWSHKKPEGAPYVPWRSVPSGAPLSPVPSVQALKLFAVRTGADVAAATSPSRAVPSGSRLERFIRQNMDGQANARVKAVRRTKKGEGKGLYVETDSRWCERIQAEHKSNHVWFYILDGTIQQKCLNEDCLEFSGREHFLPPSISDEAPGVAGPAHHSAVDLLPETWRGSFQILRTRSAPVLGPGSP